MLPFSMFHSTNPQTSRPSRSPRPQLFPTPSLFFHSPSSVNTHQPPQPFSFHGLTSQFSVTALFARILSPLVTPHSPLSSLESTLTYLYQNKPLYLSLE